MLSEKRTNCKSLYIWLRAGQGLASADLAPAEAQGSPRRHGEAARQVLYVVVYHVTIVAIGHGLLKKFWPWY